MKAAWIAAAALGLVMMTGCGVYVRGTEPSPDPDPTTTAPPPTASTDGDPQPENSPASSPLPGTNENAPNTANDKPVLRIISEGEAGAAAGQTGPTAGQTEPVNLTVDGKLDWVHWRPVQYGSVARKKDASAISTDIALLNDASVSYYTMTATITMPRIRFSWTDGQPTTASNDDHYALYSGDVGSGIAVKLDATKHAVATIYASAIDASARLVATLSDESAPPVTSKIVQGPSTGFSGKFVIELKGAAKDATVTIKWLMESELVGGKLALAAISME